MRVIAGSAGGIPLSPPPRVTRPTMDKVRAAIFSSLGDAVPASRVLDLYAGSGALGIEALSRGAATAVFVDRDRDAAACIRKNLARTKLTGSIQTMEVARFLPVYAHPASFDLIFADPPYDDADAFATLLTSVPLAASLAPGGTFILESARPLELPADSPWEIFRSRSYGESTITFLLAR